MQSRALAELLYVILHSQIYMTAKIASENVNPLERYSQHLQQYKYLRWKFLHQVEKSAYCADFCSSLLMRWRIMSALEAGGLRARAALKSAIAALSSFFWASIMARSE